MRVSKRSSVALLIGALLPASAFAGGMPQLEFTNWLVQGQVFWGAGIFLFFYLVLHFQAMPKIEKTLERRSSRIKNDLNLAHESKVSAEQAHAEMQQVQKEAVAQAQAHIKTIQDNARQAAEQAAKEASDRLAKAHAETLVKLQGKLEESFKELPVMANEIAMHISSRLVPALPKKTVTTKIEPVVRKHAESIKGCIKL